MNIEIARVPRPLGVTEMLTQYNKVNDPDLLRKVQAYIIQNWMVNGGYVCGISMSTTQLAQYAGVSLEEIYLQMRDNLLSSKIWDTDEKKQQEMIGQIMGLQLSWALEDRVEVVGQVELLKRSQGGTYKPFISGEVNKALDLKLKTSNNLTNLIKNLTGGGSINIFNNQNNGEQQVHNGVTVEDAVQMIHESQRNMIGRPEEIQYVEAHYDIGDMPEIVATKQTGIDTSKEGLQLGRAELEQVIDNYKGSIEADILEEEDLHDTRREKMQNVDIEAEDPETDIY